MSAPEDTEIAETNTPARGACLTEGCPCKDARIVSHRRAAFYATVARSSGETADRVVLAEPGWRLPAPVAAGLDLLLARGTTRYDDRDRWPSGLQEDDDFRWRWTG